MTFYFCNLFWFSSHSLYLKCVFFCEECWSVQCDATNPYILFIKEFIKNPSSASFSSDWPLNFQNIPPKVHWYSQNTHYLFSAEKGLGVLGGHENFFRLFSIRSFWCGTRERQKVMYREVQDAFPRRILVLNGCLLFQSGGRTMCVEWGVRNFLSSRSILFHSAIPTSRMNQ